MKSIGIVSLILLLFTSVAAADWKELPALPDKEGFAGALAGVSNDALLVAGGANFPGKKPWEGGTKVWHDTVYVLETPDSQWKVAGKLPRPLGYGISVTHNNSIICVGGSDAERHYATTFRLTWREGKLTTTSLPSLPRPVANASGALVGETLYIAGGLESPDATTTLKTIYRLDLAAAKPRWEELDAWPGSGRMLAVAAGYNGAFWLVGGCDLVIDQDKKASRRYLRDAYRYDPQAGWKRIADLPYAVVAAASPAPHDLAGFYVLGGDDGSQVAVEPTRHRGFLKMVLRLDEDKGQWRDVGEMPRGVVTLPTVRWHDSWVLPSGEVRPGIRTPQVMRWTANPQE